MLKTIFFLLPCVAYAALTPNAPVPITSTEDVSIMPTVAANSSVYMATWVDTSNAINFAVSSDQGSTWTTSPYPNSNNPLETVPVWIAASGSTFTIVWSDLSIGTAAGNMAASRTTDNGATWSTPTAIQMNNEVVGGTIWGTSSGFLAVWCLISGEIYSSFSTDGLSWGSPVLIDDGTMDLISAYPQVTGVGNNFLVTWIGTSGTIYASFSSDQGANWSSKSTVATDGQDESSAVPAYANGGYLVVWNDGMGNSFSSFSSDNGATWGSANPITSNIAAVQTPVFCIGTTNGFVVSTSFSDSTGEVSVSSDNGASWSPFVTFTGGFPLNSTFVDFPFITQGPGGLMATWLDGSQDAVSVFFRGGPLAPTELNGKGKTNTFLFQKESYAALSWQPSTSSGVVGYNVYRDGVLLGQTSQSSYNDQTVSLHSSYTYKVRAVDSSGNLSSAATVVVAIP